MENERNESIAQEIERDRETAIGWVHRGYHEVLEATTLAIMDALQEAISRWEATGADALAREKSDLIHGYINPRNGTTGRVWDEQAMALEVDRARKAGVVQGLRMAGEVPGMLMKNGREIARHLFNDRDVTGGDVLEMARD